MGLSHVPSTAAPVTEKSEEEGVEEVKAGTKGRGDHAETQPLKVELDLTCTITVTDTGDAGVRASQEAEGRGRERAKISLGSK
jgi:hypothetical protein